GTGGGVGSGGEVVGVGFTGDLEDRDGQALGQLGAGSEPFAVGPALHDRLGVRVALFGFFLDVVEGVEHEQRVLQAFCGDGAQLGVVEQLDERADVVAPQHGAQKFGGAARVDQGTGFGTQGKCSQVGGLNLGGVVHAGRHAMRDEVNQ